MWLLFCPAVVHFLKPKERGEKTDDLQQLNYVLVISEVGSLNKAAELLYVAQPSLTSAIKKLEKEVWIPIFHRSGVSEGHPQPIRRGLPQPPVR